MIGALITLVIYIISLWTDLVARHLLCWACFPSQTRPRG